MTLHDSHGQKTGSLVVQLLDSTPHTDEASAIVNATHSVDRVQEQVVSPPDHKPVQNAAEDSGDSVLNSLRQVIEKIKFVANSFGKTAEVHPIPSSSHGPIDRAHSSFSAASSIRNHCLAGHGIGIHSMHPRSF